MKAQDFLQAGLCHMQDRAATYDKPTGERSMAATVGAFKFVSGVEMTEEQGWLFMGLLKMVRSQQGAFKADNYEDEAAYSGLRGECAFAARANVNESAVTTSTGDAASPVPHGGVTNADGWIGWPGGDCPLKDSGIEYDLKFGDGEILVEYEPESYAWDIETAGCHKDMVIAYRIHKAGE